MPKNQTITFRGDEAMRINKFLAQQGVCSRREAETLIQSGAITVNDETITEPGHKILPGQSLSIASHGQKSLNQKQTFVLFKPEGYVSAQPEGDQIPAARLLVPSRRYYGNNPPPQGTQYDMPSKGRLYAPLGRLDQDSRGLLILSEEGLLAKAIIGADSPLEKEYRVKVLGEITEEKLARLRHGLELDDQPLKPAIVENPYGNLLAITLIEGRKRQIRRMCDAVDLKVLDLIRIRIGPVRLRDLPDGHWRNLTKKERQAILTGKNNIARTPSLATGRKKPEIDHAMSGHSSAKPTGKPFKTDRKTDKPQNQSNKRGHFQQNAVSNRERTARRNRRP